MKKLLLILALIGNCTVKAIDYSDGVFFVNEDWYGHNNGSINFLSNDGNWHYRIFQGENPGHELGTTTQFGTIYGDRLYIVSKQEKDPGATITGSRLAMCDATTLKVLKEITTIGGADGRSFLGVDENKGYIGTSNGVWIYNIKSMSVETQIEETGNTSGSLYKNQIGNMIRVGDRVFAIHQQKGVIVINPQTDIIETIIPGYFGSIVLSKDGNLWLSVAKDASGSGTPLDKIVKIDPFTLQVTTIDLPQNMGIPNSWYAWTADGFCASKQENKLYWKNNGGWFASKKIYCYDIASNTLNTVVDFSLLEGGDWGLYGAGFRIHQVTDELYCSLFRGFQSTEYKVAKVDTKTAEMVEYPMIENYWFTAMPVFPDNQAPVVSPDLRDVEISDVTTIPLIDKVVDADNLESAIIPSIISVSNNDAISASIRNNTLFIKPLITNSSAIISLQFNSNGKVVHKDINVSVTNLSSVNDDTDTPFRVYPNPAISFVTIDAPQGSSIKIFNMSGNLLYDNIANQETTTISLESFQAGVYLINANNKTTKLIKL